MDPNGIPLFSLLQNKLGYLNQRQTVIAQNVANASTPGFTPHDLKAFSEQPGMNVDSTGPKPLAAVTTTQTSAMHLAGGEGGGSKTFIDIAAPDTETTLNGNQVVLEEQMMKMSETRGDYDTAIGFYQKALGMLHMAVQKPGA